MNFQHKLERMIKKEKKDLERLERNAEDFLRKQKEATELVYKKYKIRVRIDQVGFHGILNRIGAKRTRIRALEQLQSELIDNNLED